MQRLFTGLQPSGTLHIGNYFGVLKPLVEMHQKYESRIMVADYHALTTLKDPELLGKNIVDVVKDYIAVGIDPKTAIIFQQSQVSAHTELTWILNCQITMSLLELAHAYKDKEARGLVANVGLFDYPVLMASDILLYNTDIVPVGQDQKQHVEYAREIAAKFNLAYGDTFTEPQEHILKNVAIVPGSDGKKMSKSYNNTIPLFGSKDEIAKAVMRIVTDSKGESPEHVYNIHQLFRSGDSLANLYKENKGKYKILKDALVEDIESLVGPMRARRENVTDAGVVSILKEGSDRARAIAEPKMHDVRKKIGVTI